MSPAKNEIAPHLAKWIARAAASAPPGSVPLLFLSGPQGSGKTTALAAAIQSLPIPVMGAGIDDFYLPRAGRAALARDVSPLFAVRGPPGTHDLALLRQTISDLRSAHAQSSTPLSVFDKLSDERAPVSQWRRFKGRPGVIVIEGWLMGALPDPGSLPRPPLNDIERAPLAEDWRRYQEQALADDYAPLWDEADGFFHILPPDFACVLDWRLQQEAALWAAKDQTMPDDRRAWVARFIQHYERLTRRMIGGGRRPGAELRIDAGRKVIVAPAS